MTHRTPHELIQLYWGRVWNARETSLIREICDDPIVRHDPMSVTALSHDDQVARVQHQSEAAHPFFTHEVLLADKNYVCSVWNMFTRKDNESHICGIEIFKAEDGRFTDCWNSSYAMTFWGRGDGDGDPLKPVPPRAAWAGQQDAAPGAVRSPAELIEIYRDRVLNGGDMEALRGIVADPLACHTPGGMHYESFAEMAARLSAQHAKLAPEFTHEVVLADETHVCAIWNMRPGSDPSATQCGIEVFRVENGCMAERWAAPDAKGTWGQRGDPAVPKDLPRPHLLDDVAEITPGWMQSVFLHAGVDVPRIAMINAQPIGHGNLSTTVRAVVGYNQAVKDVPLTVVCKFNSIIPEAQAKVAGFSPYRTEVMAYRYFGDAPPMRTPRAYHADVSADGLTVNLVLEDLGAFCEAGDQIAGCGQVEAAAVARELARMHAHYWGSEELKSFDWMSSNRPPNSDAAEGYRAGAAIFRARYADDLGTEDMATIAAFVPKVAAWMNHKPRVSTLIHTDPRVDNIMFDRRTPGEVHAYIIDWQVAGHGDPQLDLAYFLTGSLSVEDRWACERGLVKEHAAAIATVDPSYTVDEAMESYRRNIVSGLYMTVAASNVMPDTAHNRNLLTALARRNCAAVRDWDGLAALG